MATLKEMIEAVKGKKYATKQYTALDGEKIKVCKHCGRSAQVLICSGQEYCKWCGK